MTHDARRRHWCGNSKFCSSKLDNASQARDIISSDFIGFCPNVVQIISFSAQNRMPNIKALVNILDMTYLVHKVMF